MRPPGGSAGPLRRRDHRDAVSGGRRRHTVVVGHDAVQLVAQLERCGEMEGVQAAQFSGAERGCPLEGGRASSTARARCIWPGAERRVARRSSMRNKSLVIAPASWVAAHEAMAFDAGSATTSFVAADVSR